MEKARTTTELISQYGTYADVGDLNVSAVSEAPATTPICIVTSVISLTVVTDSEERA